ncbi:MAG: phosphoribosyltransferase family protein [Flavobacteriales bacterium]|nr:phosphoribosyltransferase family protein [Flavobacteriales bacterium]
MTKKTKILDIKEINQKLKRLAWQVYEKNSSEKEIIVVGISERGLILAKELASLIQQISKIKTKIAHLELDKDNPYDKKVVLNLVEKEYTDKVVILVDDVLNSGKTLMFAAKHFLTTPLVKLAIMVLVDRNHNRYPIKADYVGLSLATTLQEYINVKLKGADKGVYLS